MALPPQLSDDDRKAALARAAEVRRDRSEIRTKLKMGSISFHELMAKVDDDVVGKMKVLAVIESLPGVGKVKARRTMDDLRIAESRRLRGLGDKQLEKLLDLFD